jgi:hypothetical protein
MAFSIRHHHGPRPTPTPAPAPVPPAPAPTPQPGKYLFQDEFTGPAGAAPTAGTSPSSKLWTVRNCGEVNGAFVTNNTSVAYLDGSEQGNLVMAVGKEATIGAKTGFWPSAIVDTGGGPASSEILSNGTTPDFAIQPGMSCEMRVAINTVAGTWPAAWFIPVLSTGEYPADWSEIDMEESYGTGFADSSIWGTSSSKPVSENPVNMNAVTMLPKLDTGFHIFRLDYEGSGTEVTQISMYLDNATTPYSTFTPAKAEAAGCAWNYNTNQGLAIELDVAVFSKTTWQPTPPVSGSTPGVILTCDYVRAWSPAGPDPYTAV